MMMMDPIAVRSEIDNPIVQCLHHRELACWVFHHITVMSTTILETLFYYYSWKKKMRRRRPTLLTSWLMKLFIVTFVSLLSYASAEKNKHCKLQFIYSLFFELLLLLFDDVFQSRLHIMHIRQHFVGIRVTLLATSKVMPQIYFTTQFFMKNLSFFLVRLILLFVWWCRCSPLLLCCCHSTYPIPLVFSCVYSQGSIRRRSILVPSGKAAAETLIVLFFLFILFFSFALFFLFPFSREYKRPSG